VAGRCIPDDTGLRCNTASPACAQYCFGTAMNAHCTHDCGSALECPAGFSCSGVTGGRSVCVWVELPDALGCPSTLYHPTTGCTGTCRTALDCPQRLPGLPPYRCQLAGSQQVCIPPDDVLGPDAMGATCRMSGMVNLCRSGACDTDAAPAVCVQGCTPSGGCPAGWACRPTLLDERGAFYFVCRQAGAAPLGATCMPGAATCQSAMCRIAREGDTMGYCTRVCNDGVCPTGMRCDDTTLRAEGGIPLRVCVR
jgi:hypothetical protein